MNALGGRGNFSLGFGTCFFGTLSFGIPACFPGRFKDGKMWYRPWLGSKATDTWPWTRLL